MIEISPQTIKGPLFATLPNDTPDIEIENEYRKDENAKTRKKKKVENFYLLWRKIMEFVNGESRILYIE
jgi:hypothetical protein